MKIWRGHLDTLSLERQRGRHKKSYDRRQGGWVEEAIVCYGEHLLALHGALVQG